MSTITQAQTLVEEARAQLARAEEAVNAERRTELIGKLAAVRAEIREGRARYGKLRLKIHAQRQDRGNAQEKINSVLRELADSEAARPAVADFLPEDPDVVRWRKHHEALQAKRIRLIGQRDALPDPDSNGDVTEAAAYEGPQGKIAALEFSEANILRMLGPGRPEAIVTGVR
jgi:hypothetical protein